MPAKRNARRTSARRIPPVRRMAVGFAPGAAGGLYPSSLAAFHALISVEVRVALLIEAGKRLGAALDSHPDRRSFAYSCAPAPEDEAEIRMLLEERRRHQPKHFAPLQRAADEWHRAEREFRNEVERAKDLADRTSAELDSHRTPPLERTSIAIKRSLRDLSGSVPYAARIAWNDGDLRRSDSARRSAGAHGAARASSWRMLIYGCTAPEPADWVHAGLLVQRAL